MKPIKLKFGGLNSFVNTQEIDFSDLAKGVFGIFGKTGSGKTTILDAIMLALYGQISKNTKAVDFINSKCQEAIVELTFDTGDKQNKVYFVERKYKKKKDGTAASNAWFGEIVGENKNYLAEGVRDVDAYIKEVVGLSYNEFSKCMALPQGEFAGFLNATAGERTEIISNIFSLQEYGDKLVDKVKTKYGEAETKRQVLEAQKAMLKVVTEADIDKVLADINEKQNALEEMNKTREQKSKVYQEKKAAMELISKKLQLVEELEALYKRRGEFLEKSNINERQKRALTIVGSIRNVEDLTKETARLKTQVFELSRRKNEIQNRYSEFVGTNAEFDKNYQNNLIALSKKESALIGAVEDEMIIFSLKSNAEELKELISEFEGKQKGFYEQAQEIEAEAIDNKTKIESLQREIKELEQNQGAQISLKEIRDIESEIIIYQTLEAQVEKLIDNSKEELADAELQYSKLVKREKEIQEGLGKLGINIEQVLMGADDENYKKLKSVQDQLTKIQETEYRIEFVNGLINSKNKSILAQKEKVIVLEKEKDKVHEELERVNNEINISREELVKNQLLKYHEKLSLKMVEIQSRIMFILDFVGREKKELEDLNQYKNKLYLRHVDNNSEKEENFKKLKQSFEVEAQSLYGFFDKDGSDRKTLIEIQKDKVEYGTRISMIKEHEKTLLDLLFGLQRYRAEHELTIYNARENLQNQNIETEITIEESIKQKEQILRELLISQAERIEKQSSIQLQLQLIDAEIKNNKEKLENLGLQLSEKENIYNQLIQGQGSASKVLKQTREKLRDLTERFDYNNEKKEKLRVEVENALQEYSLQAAILDQKVSELSDLSFDVNGKIFDLGFKDVTQVKEYIVSENEMLALDNEISDYKQNVAIKEKQLENLTEELDGVNVDEYEFKKMENELTDLGQRISEEQILLGTLISALNQMKEDFKKLEEINKQLPDILKVIDDAKELLGLLRGKALVEYMAEEYLIEITKNASDKLNMLMGGRYELAFENNDFVVYDNFNDHKQRVVQTLSGGETFLVSLSLALAISETISFSSSKSMEFFFLDEGFGTLDSDLIESVISALYKLESHNLKVGLISHVKELEEEIKNKVLVEKATETEGSTLKVVHML